MGQTYSVYCFIFILHASSNVCNLSLKHLRSGPGGMVNRDMSKSRSKRMFSDLGPPDIATYALKSRSRWIQLTVPSELPLYSWAFASCVRRFVRWTLGRTFARHSVVGIRSRCLLLATYMLVTRNVIMMIRTLPCSPEYFTYNTIWASPWLSNEQNSPVNHDRVLIPLMPTSGV